MSSEIEKLPEPPPSAVPKARPGKVGGRRDTNRRERVKALLDGALPLFLERGIEGTTIDDIAKAAGVAKGSFYRYFESKARLVEALFRPVAEQMEAVLAACDEGLSQARDAEGMNAAYERLGEGFAKIVLSHTDVVQLYLQENRGPRTEARAPVRDLADLVVERAVHLTKTARQAGLLRPFPAEVSARTVIGAVERLLFAVLSGEEVGNPLELPEHLTSLVLDGLRGVR